MFGTGTGREHLHDDGCRESPGAHPSAYVSLRIVAVYQGEGGHLAFQPAPSKPRTPGARTDSCASRPMMQTGGPLPANLPFKILGNHLGRGVIWNPLTRLFSLENLSKPCNPQSKS